MEEVEVLAAFEANQKGLGLTVTCVDHGAEIEIDRHTLASAVGNLLQNAFKFTHEKGNVTLATSVTAGGGKPTPRFARFSKNTGGAGIPRALG